MSARERQAVSQRRVGGFKFSRVPQHVITTTPRASRSSGAKAWQEHPAQSAVRPARPIHSTRTDRLDEARQCQILGRVADAAAAEAAASGGGDGGVGPWARSVRPAVPVPPSDSPAGTTSRAAAKGTGLKASAGVPPFLPPTALAHRLLFLVLHFGWGWLGAECAHAWLRSHRGAEGFRRTGAAAAPRTQV